MSFQYDTSRDFLESVLASRPGLLEGWHRIIDFYEQQAARPYWSDFRNLDITAEREAILAWWHGMLREEPLPESVVAFWLGLFKFMEETSNEESYSLYLVGCEHYHPDQMDWTADPVYEPEGRYFIPARLNRLGALLRQHEIDHHDDYCLLDWILPLAWCALILDDLIRHHLDKTLLLRSRSRLFVQIGFDDGDYLYLSAIE